MKRTLLVMGASLLVIVGFVLGGYFPSSFIVENDVREVIVETEVTPDWAQDEDAVKAAQGVIRKKELEAELEVLKAERADVDARIVEVEKELGTYWAVRENIEALIKATFPEDPHTAVRVAWLESEYSMIQSRHVYTATNAPPGFKPGDREQSFCMFQIHEPVHRETINRLGLHDYRTNVESCVKMARVVYDQVGGSFHPWSVYKNILAMR